MEPIAARPMRLRAVHHVYIGTLDTREGTERIFDGARAVGAVNALGVEDRVAFAV